ncbi:MAG: ArsR/SmtB family transcription factor, partial [Candidatus Binataceae bacterium]
SRAAMLSALADGRALPSGELARIAHVTPQTASSHLDKLFKGRLLSVEVQGAHHYFRLRDARIADLLESLSIVARPPEPLTGAQRDASIRLRFARTCYGHLAGQLGVALTRALCEKRFLRDGESAYAVTSAGSEWFGELGIEVGSLQRRPLTRRCLDWSERQHHLAGALGVAWYGRLIELGWLARVRESRAIRLTAHGSTALRSKLGVMLETKAVSSAAAH